VESRLCKERKDGAPGSPEKAEEIEGSMGIGEWLSPISTVNQPALKRPFAFLSPLSGDASIT
jgi:hypothetical protein